LLAFIRHANIHYDIFAFAIFTLSLLFRRFDIFIIAADSRRHIEFRDFRYAIISFISLMPLIRHYFAA
jgi:energy-converting hydrogenase Eha subunit H